MLPAVRTRCHISPDCITTAKSLGVAHSLVAISIFDDQIMGVISDAESDINLGRVNTQAARSENAYVIYRDKYLVNPPTFSCGTADNQDMDFPVDVASPMGKSANGAPVNACPVRVFLDCDFALYQSNGSNVSATMNMATANFNVAKTVFSNESVAIEISEIHVWTGNDPFANWDKSLALGQLRDYYNPLGVNGNLAMLLQPENIGGIAWLDVFCSHVSNYGVSGNINYPNPYPNFTYGSKVLTHELGHNMGSESIRIGVAGRAVPLIIAGERRVVVPPDRHP